MSENDTVPFIHNSPTLVETIPAITRNFDMNPASGGTPARASMKMNIAVPINGSLRARPESADSLLAPPSISRRPKTRNAPNLNATRTKRWNSTAATIASA